MRALIGLVDEAVSVVAVEDLLNGVEIGVHVADVGLAEDEGVQERLGDLRLAPARDGGRLVRLGGPRSGAHQMPLGGVALTVLGVDPVPARGDVDLADQQRDGGLAAVGAGPGDRLGAHREMGAAGHQDDRVVVGLDRRTVRARLEASLVALQHPLDRGVRGGVRVCVLLAEVVARVGQGAAGVLLLHAAEEVGRVADLGLDLLLAVAVVVVRDDGDDDAPLVASHEFEGLAVVVELGLILEAHAVAALALGGVLEARQPQLLLGQGGQVRGEDDAAGVAGP